MSFAEIANQAEVTLGRDQVRRWCRRFELEGYEGLKTRPRSGQPRLASQQQNQILIDGVRANRCQAVRTTIQEVIPDYPAGLRAAQKM